MFTSARKLVINVSIVRREPSSLLKGCNGFPVFAKPVVSRAEKEKGPGVVRNQCCSLLEQGKGFGDSVGPQIDSAQTDQNRSVFGIDAERLVSLLLGLVKLSRGCIGSGEVRFRLRIGGLQLHEAFKQWNCLNVHLMT